jgi:hypothetical protein
MLAEAPFEHYAGKPRAGFSSHGYGRALSTVAEPPKARRVEIPPDLYGMSEPSPDRSSSGRGGSKWDQPEFA